MTVVVAIDYLDEILLIADTRVSYPDGSYNTDYGLKKLYVISDGRNLAILGFAGRVKVAKAVMTHIWNVKLPNYTRKFILPHFKNELRKWIEEVTTKLDSDDASSLQLIMAGFEMRRRRPLRLEDGRTVQSPYFERHIYKYRVKKSGMVEAQRGSTINIIGSGRELETIIKANVDNLIDFGRKTPEFHQMRLHVLNTIIGDDFREMNSKTVGGPYQAIGIIPPNNYQWAYPWPEAENDSFDVTHEDGKTILKNLSTGHSCTLLPIFQWNR